MNNKTIETVKDFQSSANILYDLNNDSKIKKFIGTNSSIENIKKIFSDVLKNTQKAKILVGPYGKGKSHLVLVILSLLYKKDLNLFKNLLEKIKIKDLDFYEILKEYIESDKKVLPVVIGGNSSNLSQSFMIGLHNTLKSENLDDIMPETNFLAVLKAIENWEKNYKDTYDKFLDKLEEPIGNFILGIKKFDLEKYDKFRKLYPLLTSGSEFNPFLGFDIVELYENVAKKLTKYGYSGIYIVYDEFGKYLEGNINKGSINDTKLLQDFAEKCERTKHPQMNLLLINHKDIESYMDDKVSKDKIDNWRGVSGRFEHINLKSDFTETYELISLVIKKDENFWKEFLKENKEKFNDLKEEFIRNKYFSKSEIDIVVDGCFPLHPISTFILPRISEKIAQNERTLFTFLSAEQKYSLNNFLNKYDGKFELLTPDYLFDYFEPLIQKELYLNDDSKLYRLTKNILDKNTLSILEKKIVKTIFLIYNLNLFDRLEPTKEIIIESYKHTGFTFKEIEEAIDNLIDKEFIIYLKRSNNYLKIKETSGKNIKEEINNLIKKSNYDYIDILNEIPFDKYIYSNRYNDEKEIVRYFKFEFISSKEFLYTKNWDKRLEKSGEEGLIVGVLNETKEDLKKIYEYITQISTSRIIFVTSEKIKNIKDLVLEYKIINELKEKYDGDSVLNEEYDIYLEDVKETLDTYISFFSNPELKKAKYFNKAIEIKIRRKSQLTNLLSDIFEESFSLTPIINNEVINKNIISTATITSRGKVINAILQDNLEVDLGFKSTSQEAAIIRATLINKKIIKNEKDRAIVNILNIEDKNIKNILEVIDGFLKSSGSNSPKNFKGLYEKLTLAKHKIGLKKGIIPLFISVFFNVYKNSIVVNNSKEDLKINFELLNNINKNPENFYVYLEEWSEKKLVYLSELEKIYEGYIKYGDKTYNNFSYIAMGIQNWYLSLPKYAKEKNFDLEIYKKFKKNIEKITNEPREALFKNILDIFGYEDFCDELIEKFKKIKFDLDSTLDNLIKEISIKLREIFEENHSSRASLISILKDFEEGLKISTKSNIFSNNENKILDLIKNTNNNEEEFIKKLVRIETNLRIEDTNEKIIENFIKNIKEFKIRIKNFDKTDDEIVNTSSIGLNKESYKFEFVDEEGKENIKIFKKIDVTRRGEMMYNEIVSNMDEYGNSLSQEEKRQILIKILTELS